MEYLNCILKTLLVIIIVPKSAFQIETNSDFSNDVEVLHRERRQLLYPYSTVLQLNIGIGTPTPVKTIQVNWAIQANFQLPWNRSQIPLDILHANGGYGGDSRRLKRDLEFDNKIEEDGVEYEKYDEGSLRPKESDEFKLYHLYKNVEEILNGYGYNGSECVRQALCQLAADPLYPHDEEDLLHEIADFLLNPNHDIEGSDLSTNGEALQYIEAYDYGLKSEDCLKKYDGCTLSLLDMFTKLY